MLELSPVKDIPSQSSWITQQEIQITGNVVAYDICFNEIYTVPQDLWDTSYFQFLERNLVDNIKLIKDLVN